MLGDERLCGAFHMEYKGWWTLKVLFQSSWEWWRVVKEKVKRWFIGVGKCRAWEKRELGQLKGRVQCLIWEGMGGREVKRELGEAKRAVEK